MDRRGSVPLTGGLPNFVRERFPGITEPRVEVSPARTQPVRIMLSGLANDIVQDANTARVVKSVTETLQVPEDQTVAANNTIAKLNSFAFKIRQLDSLTATERELSARHIPMVTRLAFHDVQLKTTDVRQVPLLVSLLETTVGKQLETAPEIEAAMRQTLSLRNTDRSLAKQILQKLVAHAQDKGVEAKISKEVGDKVLLFFKDGDGKSPDHMTASERAEEKPEPIFARERKAHQARNLRVDGIIKGITLSEQRKSEIKRRIYEQYRDNDTATSDRIEIEAQAAIADEERRIKGDLLRAYHNILSGWTSEQHQAGLQRFLTLVDRHAASISPGDYSQLRTEADAGVKAVVEAPATGGRTPPTPEDYMQNLEQTGGFTFQSDHHELIKALAGASELGSTDALKEYYLVKCGGSWDRFFENVREVFEHVLSQAETRPNDFFDQSFDQFTTRRVYSVLINYLQQAGNAVAKDNMGDVQIKDLDFLPSYDQMLKQEEVVIGGKASSPREKTVNVSFAKALNDYLPRNMIRLMNVTEYLHNSHAITNLGLGFEQMAKFSERLSTTDLDWLYRTVPKMSDAYQYYMRAHKEVLASESYISPTAFGAVDQVHGLDVAQRLAYFQMLSELPPGKEAGQRENLQAQRRIKYLVRAASGIAKGGTMEYWSALLGSKMMVSWKKDKENVFSVKQLYTSSHDSGMEKMLATIDLDLLYERFALPPEWHKIRDVFQPRDWDDYDGWSNEGYTHTDVDKFSKLTGDAEFRGRTDELKEHDEKNISMRDMLTTHVLDFFFRGGWRFAQYEGSFVHRDVVGKDGRTTREIDPIKTLSRVREVGLFLTKKLLDDHFGMFEDKDNRPARWRNNTELDEAYKEYNAAKKIKDEVDKKQKKRAHGAHYVLGRGPDGRFGLRNNWKAERLVHAKFEKAKTKLMAKLYEVEVFDRMTDMRPTKWLSTERRRLTPFGEKTLFERLNGVLTERYTEAKGFPSNFVEKKLYPVCVSALGMAESVVWKNRSKSLNFDYLLTEEMIFGDKEMVDRLKEFYRLNQENTGNMQDANFAGGLSLEKISPEEFIVVLRGFFRELKQGIADPDRLSVEPGKPRPKAERDALKEKLSARYARLLQLRQGDIDKVLGGDDFDHTAFFYMGAGGRALTRIGHDTEKVAKDMIPAMGELIMKGIPGFAHHGLRDGDRDGIKEGVNKLLVPSINKAGDVVTQLSAAEGHEFKARMLAFMPRLFGADAVYRMPLLGSALQSYMGRLNGTEPNFVSMFFRNKHGFKTTVLGSEGCAEMVRAGTDALEILRDEFEVHEYGEPDIKAHPIAAWFHEKLPNIPIVGAIFGEASKAISGQFLRAPAHFHRSKWNFQAVNRVSGPDTAKERIGQYWHMYAFAAILAFGAAAWLALQQNKKNEGK